VPATLARVAARTFLLLVALLFLPYGVYCFFQPGFLAGAAGVGASTPTGNTELRAMYGGLQMAIGALALLGALRPGFQRPALLLIACVGGGLGAARLLGAVLDGAWSSYTVAGLALEWTLLLVAFSLLRRSLPVPARA
jgi:hypothetical protein